ncbi:MAG: hypothetical protein QW117_00380 [Candidatus Pacearchaeota archaeon]
MEKTCQKCKGTGVIKEKDGTIHTCWDCLGEGKMDQHSKDVKESGIKV